MPSLSSHTSSSIVKLLLMGESGAGKTGSLVSLVKEGYKVRVVDMDNGLDSLVSQVKHSCPDKIVNVEYETFRDKLKFTSSGPIPDGTPTAFTGATKLIDNWKTATADLGPASKWGPESILVIDSLTFLSNAAMAWAHSLDPSAKDKRQVYFHAQQTIESIIGALTSAAFGCNVIITAHIQYDQRQDGTTKGYPVGPGSALGPKIPAYFNAVALMETVGAGTSIKRTIRTVPTALIDLKNPAPFAMAPSLPIETALADFFRTVKGVKK